MNAPAGTTGASQPAGRPLVEMLPGATVRATGGNGDAREGQWLLVSAAHTEESCE